MTVMLVQNYGVADLWRNSIKAEANFPGVFSAEKVAGLIRAGKARYKQDVRQLGTKSPDDVPAGDEVTGRRGSETEGRPPRGR